MQDSFPDQCFSEVRISSYFPLGRLRVCDTESSCIPKKMISLAGATVFFVANGTPSSRLTDSITFRTFWQIFGFLSVTIRDRRNIPVYIRERRHEKLSTLRLLLLDRTGEAMTNSQRAIRRQNSIGPRRKNPGGASDLAEQGLD